MHGEPVSKESELDQYLGGSNDDDELRLWEGIDGRPFHKVTLRKQWVDHLVKNQTSSGLSQSAKNDLFDWVRTTRLSAEELLAIW